MRRDLAALIEGLGYHAEQRILDRAPPSEYLRQQFRPPPRAPGGWRLELAQGLEGTPKRRHQVAIAHKCRGPLSIGLSSAVGPLATPRPRRRPPLELVVGRRRVAGAHRLPGQALGTPVRLRVHPEPEPRPGTGPRVVRLVELEGVATRRPLSRVAATLPRRHVLHAQGPQRPHAVAPVGRSRVALRVHALGRVGDDEHSDLEAGSQVAQVADERAHGRPVVLIARVGRRHRVEHQEPGLNILQEPLDLMPGSRQGEPGVSVLALPRRPERPAASEVDVVEGTR